jgi:hypothetical protein
MQRNDNGSAGAKQELLGSALRKKPDSATAPGLGAGSVDTCRRAVVVGVAGSYTP